MKVLVVLPYFYPKIGGVEMDTFSSAKGLQELGHQVLVVTSNHVERKRLDEEVDGLRVIRLPISFKISNTPLNPRWYFQLKKIIRMEKPDVIEAHSPVPGMADMAFVARGNAKYVIKYHAGSMKKGRQPLDLLIGAYERVILKRLLQRSDEVMSVYPEFIHHLIGRSKQVHYVPPGVDTELFKPDARAVKSNDILFVGRIDRSSTWKGIGTLIEAMPYLLGSRPEIRLTVVGSGDGVDDFKRQVENLGLQKNVVFPGALYGSHLVEVYNSSRVLVLPSESDAESFGSVLIEAMACGIPVIGSNIGGIPNVIQNGANGYLVSPKNAKELAKIVDTVLTNVQASIVMGSYGRDYVLSSLTRHHLVTRTEGVLTGALNVPAKKPNEVPSEIV